MDSFELQTPELEYDYFCEQQSNGAAAVKSSNLKVPRGEAVNPGGKGAGQFGIGGNTSKRRKLRTVNILTAKRGTPSSFKETMARGEATVKRSQNAKKAAAARAAKKKQPSSNPFGAAPANLF